MNILKLTFAEFAARDCELQCQTPEGLRDVLTAQKATYKPDGWMMLEVAYIGQWNSGDLTILPYGGSATFKSVPDHPVSPRGLCSDMSTVCATMDASEIGGDK